VRWLTSELRIVVDKARASDPVSDRVSPKHQRELTMFTKIAKTLTAAFVLATSSIALNATANAGPGAHQFPTNQEQSWMERASRSTDGGAQ
jgi:hypothetical protein